MARSFGYGLSAGDFAPAAVLGVWLLLCAHVLAVMARVGACDLQLQSAIDLLLGAYKATGQCTALEGLGGALAIGPEPRDGGLLGIASGVFSGTYGLLYALGLMALAGSVTIFFVRWHRNACDDSYLIALLWTGALLDALPRLFFGGASEVPLRFVGIGFGISDLAILCGISWAVWRIIAERRGH